MELIEHDEMAERAAGKLAALASAHRLAVFRSLVKAGDAGMAAGLIAERLGIPASTLSFHLAHLRQAGLVSDKRAGRSIIYRADFAAMADLVRYLFEECCTGEESLAGCGVVKELSE